MKIGMVFEGGASRTIFSCGVADAFLEEDIMPDYFVGVSAGIAYGVSYLSKQKGRNLTLAKRFMNNKKYQGYQHLFNKEQKSYYNVEYVFHDVPKHLLPFDYEAFAAFPGEVEACVTNIHTGKAEYLPVARDESSADTLVASCALPVFFKPVKVGNHYYLDGGLSDSIPYLHAFEKGCDRVVVVLTRQRDYVKKTDIATHISTSLYKKYPNVVKDLKERPEKYNQSLLKLRELEEQGKVFVIAPETTMGVGRTETDPEKLEALYQEGYRIAKEQMEDLKQYCKQID
ncbi:MAG: patatin family protein [Roseburia sp.]